MLKKIIFISLSLSFLSTDIIADNSNSAIDANRLLAASNETANWLSFGKDYTNQNFSSLNFFTIINH